MEKFKILEALNNSHEQLNECIKILKKIAIEEVWDINTQEERDRIVIIEQKLPEYCSELIEIEKIISSKI